MLRLDEPDQYRKLCFLISGLSLKVFPLKADACQRQTPKPTCVLLMLVITVDGNRCFCVLSRPRPRAQETARETGRNACVGIQSV